MVENLVRTTRQNLLAIGFAIESDHVVPKSNVDDVEVLGRFPFFVESSLEGKEAYGFS